MAGHSNGQSLSESAQESACYVGGKGQGSGSLSDPGTKMVFADHDFALPNSVPERAPE